MSQSLPDLPPQNQSLECNKPDPSQFYENIIRDAISGPSFDDSSNLEAKRLLGKASLSAASAFTSKTMNSFVKAWGQFRYFCDKMGYDLIEVSGLELAT